MWNQDARLVVLSVQYPYSRDPGSEAENAAKAILDKRGSAPRLYRNTLAFLAADKTRLQDLDEAVRRYLAWDSILDDKVQLDITPQQVRQAEEQKRAADATVTGRIPETYQWLLVPGQSDTDKPIAWEAIRLTGTDRLAVRAGRKLVNDENLLSGLAGTRLRMELDKIPLWPADHVAIRQLADYFAQYLYLPRLKDPAVLAGAIRDGVGRLTWERETFAYADSFDEAASRYRGLRGGENIALLDCQTPALLVKPEVARRQMDAESAVPPTSKPGAGESGWAAPDDGHPAGADGHPTTPARPAVLKRFHGTVTLDPTRAGRDAARIAKEVIAHLAGLLGAALEVTLEIQAGVPENVIRTVTENANTLKFSSQGFEEE